jgi:signal transduction histidine kinase/DNA-binding response OmpR family regulator
MSPPRPPETAARIALSWLIGLCAASSVGCLTFAVYIGVTAESDASAAAMREMAGQADALARQIDSDVALFDLALREAVVQSRIQGARDRDAPPVRLALLDHPLTTKQIEFINILNEVGDVIADSRSNVSRLVNFAGRDYFRDQAKNAAGTLMIGRPFATAPTQHAAIPISRRITAPDGSFAGVVVAGVYLSWLRELLSHPPPGIRSSVTVRRDDGTILMQSPYDAGAIGHLNDADPAWQAFRQSRSDAPIDTASANGMRLFRQTSAVPLILEVAEDRAAVEGEARPWLFRLPPLTLIPAFFALVLGSVAITFQRRGDRVEAAAHRANDERMRLLATMSHELRTPLTGILGQAELLRAEGGLTEHQAARLARLADAGTAMRDIVNRVIDISRPEDHVITPVLARCDLDILVRTSRGMVETFAVAKGLRLSGYVHPSAPKYAILDRGLVEQVLVNLLMNAVNFTGAGTVDLRLTADPEWLRFEVTDTGPGIAANKRHRLFREYDRLDVRDSRAVGIGLGLWITRTIVIRLGGSIGHLENPGGGSVFWVELPLLPAGETNTAAPDRADSLVARQPEPAMEDGTPVGTPVPVPPHRHLHILLADDMDVTREVTADFLRSAGHAVTEVADGEAAVREAQTRQFDVILTDMRMPVIDGLETTRRIRALPGHLGRTPIVLVTADLAALQRGASGQDGFDLCVMKPLTRPELLDAVDAAARLTPVPEVDDPDSPVLDPFILAQLCDSLGEATVDTHFRAAATRIEALLVLLRSPDATSGPEVRDAVHDLVGVAGMMGMTALSSCLRRFDIAEDREGPATALRDAAEATVKTLRCRPEHV